jgi:hypothetical protein
MKERNKERKKAKNKLTKTSKQHETKASLMPPILLPEVFFSNVHICLIQMQRIKTVF